MRPPPGATSNMRSIVSQPSSPRSSSCWPRPARNSWSPEMKPSLQAKPCLLETSDAARHVCADRIGIAKLAKLAFDGKDIRSIWRELMAKLLDGTGDAGEGIDLSL